MFYYFHVQIWKDAEVRATGEETHHRMNVIWGFLRSKVPHLAKIALSVLVIPQSNAAEERVFSHA